MNQIEEYRDALDGLRFSDAGKERIMKNLMEQGKQTVKVRHFRPMRAALVAAVLVAISALMLAAGIGEYKFDLDGGLVSGYGADGADFSVRVPGNGGSPVVLRDGRLWLSTSENQQVDVTDLIDGDTPQIYPYTDPQTGNSAFLVIGGTPEEFGWAVVIPRGTKGHFGSSGLGFVSFDPEAKQGEDRFVYASWYLSALELLDLQMPSH